jgi:LysM repeat protein
MKIFSKLASLRLRKKKPVKMRATVARRPLRAATANYDDMAEPNMKLSRALLIVLLLHIVAVSGIIAFNAIKTRQGPTISRAKTSAAPAAARTDMATSSSAEVDAGKHDQIRRARPVTKPNGKEAGKGSDTAHTEQTHKTYTVAKGDSPVSIAKKFKVSQDELLALNRIDDPRKLKIGQKLLIPNKTVKGKKGDE